ncbi:hypothetical protein RD149_16215 [Gordonia westfalica]|uniref:Uncharacterized protein n=1 Tax=Gordonia westfalica TaxID=158898 RepID=A0ABU2GX43_9ACTN|nr:hypothetical protein [Gordonia westfalica]MDS1115304.1 hypothetical protein [Gordonia westfalica]
MNDRYSFTRAEDAGLGADEFEGPARFTRRSEQVAHPVDSSNIKMGDTSGMDLDSMFDSIEDGRRSASSADSDQEGEAVGTSLRSCSRQDPDPLAAKDPSNEIQREMTMPPTSTAKHQVEGDSTTLKEK